MKWRFVLGLSLAIASLLHAAPPASAPGAVALAAGQARRLAKDLPPGTPWTSSQEAIAEVLDNGYVIALAPGTAQIRAGDREWTVTVAAPRAETRDLASIEQYSDDRKFKVGGRLCFGCELNSRAVSAEDRATASSNRIINPRPLTEEKKLYWEVAPNTPVVDGAGILIGQVAPTLHVGDRTVPVSKFNYGMSKIIDGRLYLYAFGVDVHPDAKVMPLVDEEARNKGIVGVSAWLPIDSVLEKSALAERIGIGTGKHPRMPVESRKYRITGGNPQAYFLAEGKELRIVSDPDAPPTPSHYLRRPSGTVNVLYSVPGFGLGGQGLDAVLVSGQPTFSPAKGVRRFVRPTYFPAGHPREGKKSDRTMTFMYGLVEEQGKEIAWGWVAQEALQPWGAMH